MFEKMFTTKMSTDRKTLQGRFLQIRSGAGKRARIISAAMTAAILSVTAIVTVAVAAAGGDGLEHWTHNELIYRDGVSFNVNVKGLNVPAWVTDEVAGGDGNISVKITRYESRDLRGMVNRDHLIELSGEKGKIGLASNGWSTIGETDKLRSDYEMYENPDIKNYRYETELTFMGFTNPGFNFESMPISALINNDRSGKYVDMRFGIDETKKISAAYITFRNSDEYDNPTDEQFSTVKSETLSYDGDFEAAYMHDCETDADSSYYFMSYEDNYINTPCESVSFDFIGASAQNGIMINSDIKLPEAANIIYEVYNENGRQVSNGHFDCSKEIIHATLTPNKTTLYSTSFDGGPTVVEERDIPENQFVSGERYRICAIVFDKDYTVLYRWQQYVTME